MPIIINNKPVGILINSKTISLENIEIMKVADLTSNTFENTNYNLTDSEYIEAQEELQEIMNLHLYGGEND